MPNFKADKVIASVPTALVANSLYVVRAGAGFDLYCADNSGSIAHRLNNERVHLKLGSNFGTASTSLVAVTGLSYTLSANTIYRVEFIGAVRSSGGLGGAGIGLILPSESSVIGSCHIQVNATNADSMQQINNAQVNATSWLNNNRQNNQATGTWLVTTTEAGKLQLGLRSNSTLYTASLQANKCLLTIEEIR